MTGFQGITEPKVFPTRLRCGVYETVRRLRLLNQCVLNRGRLDAWSPFPFIPKAIENLDRWPGEGQSKEFVDSHRNNERTRGLRVKDEPSERLALSDHGQQ